MHLSKHHVFGNDFLVRLDHDESTPSAEWVSSVCNGNFGWGADGLVWACGISYANLPVISAGMTLYNADGSEAEVSGNGLACLAQALSLPLGDELPLRSAVVEVETAAGPHTVQIKNGLGDSGGWEFGEARVQMSMPSRDEPKTAAATDVLAALLEEEESYASVDRKTISALQKGEASVGYLSIGNPHVVLRVPDLERLRRFPLEAVGSSLQTAFSPVNLEVIAIEDRGRLHMRVWERGVGVTSACGSGAAAAAWQAYWWWLADNEVKVCMPGGEAGVQVAPESRETFLSVEVSYVGDCALPSYWRDLSTYRLLKEKTQMIAWRGSKPEAWGRSEPASDSADSAE